MMSETKYTHFVTGNTYDFASKLRSAGAVFTEIAGRKGWMIDAVTHERIIGRSYYGPKMARTLTIEPLPRSGAPEEV